MSTEDSSNITPISDETLADIYQIFYKIPRAGAVGLSDGGGPFGFDIHVALQVDYLVRSYGCDSIVETGCFLGDTTAYLAMRYPQLPVLTCDVNSSHASFTRIRTSEAENVTVIDGDSGIILRSLLRPFQRPFVYLDAHWGPDWPLSRELSSINSGVVAIDDFWIDHPRFGYDTYGGIVCGPSLVANAYPEMPEMYVGNVDYVYGVPCLQVGRRSGTGYVARGLSTHPLEMSPMFARVDLQPSVRLPRWTDLTPKSARHAAVVTLRAGQTEAIDATAQ